MTEYAGVHSFEVFEHVPNADLGWMPTAMAERLRRGAESLAAGARTPAPALPSSTVVPLREGAHGLEAFLLRRRDAMKFGGLWAFPGGKLEPADDANADPLRACAVRELVEETEAVADPEALIPWARWITPEALAYRFDTMFYLWPVPTGVEIVAGDAEATEGRWATSLADLEPERSAAPDGAALMPPTRATLWELFALGSLDRVRAASRTRVLEPVTPRHVRDGGGWRPSYPVRSGKWQ